MKRKYFTLISGAGERCNWRIAVEIREDGEFKSRGTIAIRENQLGNRGNPLTIRKNYLANSANNKITIEKYRKSPKGKMSRRKADSKRRGLGYVELLSPIWGCEMHHIDDKRVIPIPEIVHHKFAGLPKKEHREAVDNWMREIRPDLWLLVHLL